MIDIRDADHHLLMRYDPSSNTAEIQKRGIKTIIDLNQYKRSDMSADVNSMLLGSSTKPNRNDIDILSQRSPIINGALMYYRYDQLSYEEALILIIVTQNKIIDALDKSFIEYKSNNPYPDKSDVIANLQGGDHGEQRSNR